jgi:cell division protein FtsB
MINIKKINLALYLCIGIMAIANLISTNSLATKGIEINQLYQNSQTLKKANQQLETEVNKFNNLSYIQELGLSRGYSRIEKISIVSESSLVASKPDTIYP